MGCWNHTCAISNLHITAGQDVVVFLLIKKHEESVSSFCYGNALYDVVPLPFYGKYDDYGGVEDCTGFGLPIIMEELKSRLYKFGQGPNLYHDCEVTPDNLTVEKLFEADHEGRLGIDDPVRWSNDDYDKNKLEEMRLNSGLTSSQQYELDRLASKIKKENSFRQVTHVVIHGDIFRAITEKWYIEEYVGEGEGNKGYRNSYTHLYFKDLIASIPEYISLKKNNVERKKVIKEKLNSDINEALRNELLEELLTMRHDWSNLWDSPCHAVKWMNYAHSSGESNVWGLIHIDEMVSEYTEKEDWAGLESFVKEILTASWINSFMSFTRKIWVKQTGSGSQNSEPLGYTVLAQAVLDITEAERGNVEDEDDEDDDEDE